MKIDIILLFNICLITTAIQSQNVDIAGAITLKSTTSAPAGTIRWTGTDFEGWNGADWISLTQDGSVGLLYDIQGNEYRTRRIGNQTWMIDNLRVTTCYKL